MLQAGKNNYVSRQRQLFSGLYMRRIEVSSITNDTQRPLEAWISANMHMKLS